MARRIPEQIAAEVAQARQELSKIVPVELTFVESVIVGERLRQIDPAVVDTLAQSIAEIGLQVPITVRLEECPDGQRVHLVAGAHRLAAVRRLGWEQVPAAFTEADEIDARRWEIAENLHRAELTALERAEHVREWVRLTAEKSSAQVAPMKSRRADGRGGVVGEGINAAVRDLGLERTEAQRAVKIAEGLTPEVKAMAIANGLDDNQTVLLKLARLPADQQLEQLEEILALRQELKAARAEPAQVRNAAELEAVKASIDQRVREAEERGAAAAQETIARLEREMQDIRAAADAKTRELETTLARVQSEVEVAAKQHAEALAAQAIASRKDEPDKLKKEIAASQQRLDRSRESQARVQKEIAEHQTYLNKISSDDYAARMQSDLAGKLAKALNDAMLELADLESEPQPVAMRQLSRAAELCRRMAEALETFLAPRLTANVVTLHSQ